MAALFTRLRGPLGAPDTGDAPNAVHASAPAAEISSTGMVRLFVGLKLRLLGNGLKGSNTRMVAGMVGTAVGLGATAAGIYLTIRLHDADAADARLILVVGGSLAVLGWTVLPVLIFGVDESIDPQRFALLPLPRRTLLAGMLAAGFVGLPATATLIVSLTTVVTWWRGGLPVLYALTGAVLATSLCVLVSRTVTALLSEVFRSRRVRDVWSMGAVLVLGVIALLQVGLPSMAELATRDVVDRFAGVLAWTPLGAAWAAPYDAVSGSWPLGLARLLLVAGTLVGLLAVWELALRRALESGGSPVRSRTRRAQQGSDDPGSRGSAGSRAGRGLTPAWARSVLPGTVTGAIASRVLRLWWRDPRQRVSLLIIPLVLIGLVVGPAAAGFRSDVLVVVAPGVGTLIGLIMLNHTAFDGTAIWTHLAVPLPGRADRAGRALGTAVWALPVVTVAAVAICVMTDRVELLPATIGSSVATLLIGLGLASVTSVLIAFPAPPASANPFITPSGGNVVVVLQQFVGGLTVGLLSLPVYIALALATWWNTGIGWAVLAAGPLYGAALLRTGNRIGGRYLDENGTELLRRITPTRT